MKDSYHWMLKNSSRITPISCKGKLNIWEYNL